MSVHQSGFGNIWIKIWWCFEVVRLGFRHLCKTCTQFSEEGKSKLARSPWAEPEEVLKLSGVNQWSAYPSVPASLSLPGSSRKWLVHHSLPWPFSFALELQQMVEVCSRAAAIGECMCHGLVLRCVAIDSMTMHGQWPTFGILLQSLTPWCNYWSIPCLWSEWGSWRRSNWKGQMLLSAKTSSVQSRCLIRNYLKKARLLF